MPNGQKAATWLVKIIDTDEVDGSFRKMFPDAIEDEGGAHDVVGRHIVADLLDPEVPGCRE
jgi:hypothetical protein